MNTYLFKSSAPAPAKTHGQSKLDFNIIYCTSEDGSYPVQNLTQHMKGWLSGKFPEMPQEIILQPKSGQIETLHEIQLITSKKLPAPLMIDIFVFMPSEHEQQYEQLPLNRL
jgi:hypothetical protein